MHLFFRFKGWKRAGSFVRPFRAYGFMGTGPRALPQAGMVRPVGAGNGGKLIENGSFIAPWHLGVFALETPGNHVKAPLNLQDMAG